MKDVILGVSLYPEQESMDSMKSYLELASKYGFTRVFTSLFSVEGSPEEVSKYFKELCSIARDFAMEVCIDVNSETFDIYGATPHDLKVFHDMGVSEIRMDMSYGDERDHIIINNEFGIRIQFSAYMTDLLQNVVEKVEDKSRIIMCHNFYPQRYTGTDLDVFQRANQFWYDRGVDVAAFITSNNSDAHGPWPVKDGLPTLERHRYQSVDYQVRDMISMGIGCIYFGNAFATEEELKEAFEAKCAMLAQPKESHSDVEYLMRQILPNLGEKRIIIGVTDVQALSPIEHEIFLDFDKHCEIGDSNQYMLRSRVTRMLYKGSSIPHRACDKHEFLPGDIVIVNDNLKHYLGEIQIVRSPMANDGQRNYVGKIVDLEYSMVNAIKPGYYYSFKKID